MIAVLTRILGGSKKSDKHILFDPKFRLYPTSAIPLSKVFQVYANDGLRGLRGAKQIPSGLYNQLADHILAFSDRLIAVIINSDPKLDACDEGGTHWIFALISLPTTENLKPTTKDVVIG